MSENVFQLRNDLENIKKKRLLGIINKQKFRWYTYKNLDFNAWHKELFKEAKVCHFDNFSCELLLLEINMKDSSRNLFSDDFSSVCTIL